MKVSDILRVKGNTLYTVGPDEPLSRAIEVMADKDIGSLVVMEHGALAGMLTFREVIGCTVKHAGVLSDIKVREGMDAQPRSCAPDTELDEVRHLMLDSHARYLPVMEGTTLMGVISFYDVARAIVESQNFENRMLKAYIRDWPVGQEQEQASEPRL